MALGICKCESIIEKRRDRFAERLAGCAGLAARTFSCVRIATVATIFMATLIATQTIDDLAWEGSRRRTCAGKNLLLVGVDVSSNDGGAFRQRRVPSLGVGSQELTCGGEHLFVDWSSIHNDD